MTDDDVSIYFTEHFGIDPKVLQKYGAFNISVVSDLPLFINLPAPDK